jgi:hypothetical protein
MTDTNTKTGLVYHRMLRDMPAWKKFQVIGGLNSAIRQLSLAGIKARLPGLSEPQTLRAAAALWLGGELTAKAYKQI